METKHVTYTYKDTEGTCYVESPLVTRKPTDYIFVSDFSETRS